MYNVNYEFFEVSKKPFKFLVLCSLVIIILVLIMDLVLFIICGFSIWKELLHNSFLLISCPVILALVSLYKIKLINDRKMKVKHLAQVGTLYKNIYYRLESYNEQINFREVYKPVIDFVMPNGEKVILVGDSRYDFKEGDKDNKIDLLIDLNNPNNYFMDYEINRIGGNKEEDFYVYDRTFKDKNGYGFGDFNK